MSGESFVQRVCEAVIENALVFSMTFLKYDYLVCSNAFKKRFHVITAHEGNYLHLTGVHTRLSAADFYAKCINQSLQTTDFDFKRAGVAEKDVKGAVRKKINSLPYMRDFFAKPLYAEEGFKENRVVGTFSSSDGEITIGFVANGNPMSLLKGDRLRQNKAPVDVVLRREKSVALPYFTDTDIIYGDGKVLDAYRQDIGDYLH